MTERDAVAMAQRIARRMTKDTGVASAEDYVSLAAIALLNADTDDPAVLWTIGRHAIIDQHRQIEGRAGSARAEAVSVELDESNEPSVLPDLDEVMAGGPGEVSRLRDLAAKLPEPLTPREREIVQLMARGKRAPEIARNLFLSYETVRSHLQHARRRIGAKSAAHLVALAAARGEIELPRPW